MKNHYKLILLGLFLATSALAQEWGDQIPPSEVYVQEPVAYDGNSQTPLIIFLHGYSPVNGEWTDSFAFGIADPAYYEGYLLATPDGSYDSSGFYYWDGSEACCDFDGTNPDHVGYIEALVQSIQASHNVDPRRIHVVGYSNGGFMAHRMGCEKPNLFSSIISVAGAGPMEMSVCVPTESLSVLQIHGTLDETISYNGGNLYGIPFPSVQTIIANWVEHIGCESEPTSLPDYLNLDGFTWGDETEVIQYTNSCSSAGGVEHWKMHDAEHTFWFWYEAFEHMFTWFDQHQKPNTCPSDFDGDTSVDVSDLLLLISYWGDEQGDLNGDQITNVQDLLFLIGEWGPCPVWKQQSHGELVPHLQRR
jgi:polyhydroxybutyrate depolymerase